MVHAIVRTATRKRSTISHPLGSGMPHANFCFVSIVKTTLFTSTSAKPQFASVSLSVSLEVGMLCQVLFHENKVLKCDAMKGYIFVICVLPHPLHQPSFGLWPEVILLENIG